MGILKLKNQVQFILESSSLKGCENELEIRSETLQEFQIGALNPRDKTPKKIGLYCPKLKVIDPAIWHLPQLEILAVKCQKNACEILPQKIASDLAPLKIVRLSGLELNSIPTWFAQLSHLQELDLNNNQLQQLPLELMALKKLNRINLEQNKFKSIPLCLTRMPWLNHLALDNNPLSEEERQLAFNLWGIWF